MLENSKTTFITNSDTDAEIVYDRPPLIMNDLYIDSSIQHLPVEKEVWKQWNSRCSNFENHHLFGTVTRGVFLDNTVITNISRYLGTEVVPLAYNQGADNILAQILVREIGTIGENIASTDQQDEILIFAENNGDSQFKTRYYLPDGLNRSIILATGTEMLDTSESGDHYIAINIRRYGNDIYFLVNDSLEYPGSEINQQVYNTIREISTIINKNPDNRNFNFHIINVRHNERQQTQTNDNDYDINTCAIWSAINAVNMQNISRDVFLNLVGNKNIKTQYINSNCSNSSSHISDKSFKNKGNFTKRFQEKNVGGDFRNRVIMSRMNDNSKKKKNTHESLQPLNITNVQRETERRNKRSKKVITKI